MTDGRDTVTRFDWSRPKITAAWLTADGYKTVGATVSLSSVFNF